jgi:hypothetical protein
MSPATPVIRQARTLPGERREPNGTHDPSLLSRWTRAGARACGLDGSTR